MIIEALFVLAVASMWLKGTVMLASPSMMRKHGNDCMKREGVEGVRSWSLMAIILGLAFLYLGAYVY